MLSSGAVVWPASPWVSVGGAWAGRGRGWYWQGRGTGWWCVDRDMVEEAPVAGASSWLAGADDHSKKKVNYGKGSLSYKQQF